MPKTHDEIALDIIHQWECGRYHSWSQCMAALQVAIADALREAARR